MELLSENVAAIEGETRNQSKCNLWFIIIGLEELLHLG